MTTMTITKDQLEQALRVWEQQYRAGECMSDEACLAMTPEDLAQASANHMWKLLDAVQAAKEE